METTTQNALVIVAGIQLDATSDPVLACAAELARDREATVHLCYACGEEPSQPDVVTKLLDAHEADLQRYAGDRLIGHPLFAKTRLHVAMGEPADALARLVRDVGASFVVVGHHDRDRFRSLIEGSVAKELVEETPCSVVVAGPTPAPAERRDAPQGNVAAPGSRAGVTPRRHVRLPAQSTVGAGAQPLQS